MYGATVKNGLVAHTHIYKIHISRRATKFLSFSFARCCSRALSISLWLFCPELWERARIIEAKWSRRFFPIITRRRWRREEHTTVPIKIHKLDRPYLMCTLHTVVTFWAWLGEFSDCSLVEPKKNNGSSSDNKHIENGEGRRARALIRFACVLFNFERWWKQQHWNVSARVCVCVCNVGFCVFFSFAYMIFNLTT